MTMLKLPHCALLLLCCHALASNLDPKIVFPVNDDDTEKVLPLSAGSTLKNQVGVLSNDVVARGRYDVASEAVNGVATRLHTILDPRGTRNYVVSPFSVAIIAGQLMLGARGATKRRLRELLSPTRSTAQTNNPDLFDQQLHQQLGELLQQLQRVIQTADNYYQLRAASAFFLQTDLRVYKRFFEEVKKTYGSDIYALEFGSDPIGSYKSVNEWVSTRTGGLINDVLDGPLSRNTAALIVNTIYFRADWLEPFSTDLTVKGSFNTNATNQVAVKYMRGQFDLKFAESEELKCRLIIMPYKQKDVNMYIILPNREIGDDIKNFAKKLTPDNIDSLVKSASHYTTTVVLPKMKLQSTFSLTDPLINYRPSEASRQLLRNAPLPELRKGSVPVPVVIKTQGLNKKQVNSNTAASSRPEYSNSSIDLSGASPDGRFQPEDILHRVSLEISERGTEAAAVSLGSVDYSGDIKSFKVDRPFMFFIRHEPSLVNLFWGVIVDPSAAN